MPLPVCSHILGEGGQSPPKPLKGHPNAVKKKFPYPRGTESRVAIWLLLTMAMWKLWKGPAVCRGIYMLNSTELRVSVMRKINKWKLAQNCRSFWCLMEIEVGWGWTMACRPLLVFCCSLNRTHLCGSASTEWVWSTTRTYFHEWWKTIWNLCSSKTRVSKPHCLLTKSSLPHVFVSLWVKNSFTFLNGWGGGGEGKSKEEEYFMPCEYHIKFKYQ